MICASFIYSLAKPRECQGRFLVNFIQFNTLTFWIIYDYYSNDQPQYSESLLLLGYIFLYIAERSFKAAFPTIRAGFG